MRPRLQALDYLEPIEDDPWNMPAPAGRVGAPPSLPTLSAGESTTPQFRESATPRERENIPAPVPRAPVVPSPPVRQPLTSVSPLTSTAAGVAPAAPTLSAKAATTSAPEISAPAPAAGKPTALAAPTEAMTGPGGSTPATIQRRLARPFGGAKVQSGLFGREGGLAGGGLGVPGLSPGESLDPRIVMKLVQSLLQGQ